MAFVPTSFTRSAAETSLNLKLQFSANVPLVIYTPHSWTVIMIPFAHAKFIYNPEWFFFLRQANKTSFLIANATGYFIATTPLLFFSYVLLYEYFQTKILTNYLIHTFSIITDMSLKGKAFSESQVGEILRRYIITTFLHGKVNIYINTANFDDNESFCFFFFFSFFFFFFFYGLCRICS